MRLARAGVLGCAIVAAFLLAFSVARAARDPAQPAAPVLERVERDRAGTSISLPEPVEPVPAFVTVKRDADAKPKDCRPPVVSAGCAQEPPAAAADPPTSLGGSGDG